MITDRFFIDGEWHTVQARTRDGLFKRAARLFGGTSYLCRLNSYDADPAGKAHYQVTVCRALPRRYGGAREIIREIYVSVPRAMIGQK
jgi:hypothetical protein